MMTASLRNWSTTMSVEMDRRRFLGAAAMSTAALTMNSAGAALIAPAVPPGKAKSGSHMSFKPLKQIDAGLLNIGYAEDGPADGQAVILLHGWPYDIHSYVDVAPLLAAKGYRVIARQNFLLGRHLPERSAICR